MRSKIYNELGNHQNSCLLMHYTQEQINKTYEG